MHIANSEGEVKELICFNKVIHFVLIKLLAE